MPPFVARLRRQVIRMDDAQAAKLRSSILHMTHNGSADPYRPAVWRIALAALRERTEMRRNAIAEG